MISAILLAAGQSKRLKGQNKLIKKYKEKINTQFNKKKNGIIEGSNIFVDNYIQPIKVIVVGAVHIAQYLINFAFY